MRWLTFALLATLALCLQTTLAVRLSVGSIRPDFVFIVVVHYALHTRKAHGPVAAWILGLMMDLTSVEPLGSVSLVYCVMAAVMWSLRELVFTRHPLTHFTLTLVFCSLAHIILRGLFVLFSAPAVSASDIVMPAVLTGLYTAVWAVPVHQLLLRCGPALGLLAPTVPGLGRTPDAL